MNKLLSFPPEMSVRERRLIAVHQHEACLLCGKCAWAACKSTEHKRCTCEV